MIWNKNKYKMKKSYIKITLIMLLISLTGCSLTGGGFDLGNLPLLGSLVQSTATITPLPSPTPTPT
ncbi:MAG: hypothetical protein WCF08_10215, partial [Anaerolineaceae bacterium]